MKTILVSGYFDPLHVGHIEMFEKAKALGDKLFVIVNNDKQAALKKGKHFMNQEDRVKIIESLRCVDKVLMSVDIDLTICQSISLFGHAIDVFANGGDRHVKEIPEAKICKKLGIEIVDGLGKKIRSSSELVANNK